MPFPVEIMTMLGSGLMAGFLKYVGMKQDSKKLRHQIKMAEMEMEGKLVQAAREVKNTGFQWTRRIIAISSVGAIIVLPKLAVAFGWTDLPIIYTWTQVDGGFWPFINPTETLQQTSENGIMITPLDTHLVSAIIGMYFGGSLMGHNRR